MPEAADSTTLVSVSDTNVKFAQTLCVRPEIHKSDFILDFVVNALWHGDKERGTRNYFELGAYSANLAKELVSEVTKTKARLKESWSPTSVLDFASGYGCVARFLSQVFPASVVSACDIHKQAVEFNRDILDLSSFQSTAEPDNLIGVPRVDVLMALSFFSHMPKRTFHRWLQTLVSTVASGGVLIFTANGHVTHKTNCPDMILDTDGFGFKRASEQKDLSLDEYGLTVSYPRYVFEILKSIPNVRLARFSEALWWGSQDTYVCIKD